MCRNNPVEIVIFELVLENGPNGPPYQRHQTNKVF